MPIQTSYLDNIPAGLPGAIANMIPSTLISRTVENLSGVRFGYPVGQGVADRGCIESTTGVTAALGIAVRDRSTVGTVENGYTRYESAAIMTKGAVWVTASVAVVAGDIVHFIAATGAWAKTGGVLVPNARWDSSAGIGGIAVIRLA